MTLADAGALPRTLCAGRFQVERELGVGGMGAVYAAFDHQAERWVALKLLSRRDAEGRYRIKREFRGIAELRHPNLLSLYELIEDGDRIFFTMELVEGDPLLTALHGSRGTLEFDLRGPSDGEDKLPSPVVDFALLRSTFRQIAEALVALHAAGKLHRDVKPENVLIDGEGRAVLLDFGIAASLGVDGTLDTNESRSGTPAYMAPEAFEGKSDARCDWYAFGATLFEALVGDIPFGDRSLAELAQAKRLAAGADPRLRASGVPDDLATLVMGLLAVDPKARPGGAEVVARLGARGSSPAPPRSAPSSAPFVGRFAELEALRRALAEVRDERPRIALVHGPSGIGKSALARAFLRQCAKDPKTWLLAGTCYENESLRFKVFDGVVDALSRCLCAMPRAEAASFMPRRLAALVAVFPVLARVPMLGAKRRPERFELPADPMETRHLAFEALRDLLGRLALMRRVIVFTDDVQWGDVDSATLLRALVTGEPAPGALFVLAYRGDEAERSPCLRAILELREERPDLFVDVPVLPLVKPDALLLGRTLGGGLDAATLERLSRDAEGSPFLLTELVSHYDAAGVAEPVRPDVAGVLERRIVVLSPLARELLELLSVAGRPLQRSVYGGAREVPGDLQAAVDELSRARLIRSTAGRGGLCPYHDRVRDVVNGGVSPERRAAIHARIARVLEAQPDADLETLAQHWAEAGDEARARDYAHKAAELAVRRLAFERAAALFRLALSHTTAGSDAERALLDRLAAALVLAGRRAEAAEVYLEGARELTGAPLARARQLAGQQLLLSGYSERGLSLLREALADLGCPMHADLGDALLAWGEQHARLVQRGLTHAAREPEEVPEPVAMRLDTLWAASFGLNRVEGIRSYAALAQHLYEALEGGDVARVVRGLCMYHAVADYPAHLFGGPLLGAREAAERIVATSAPDDAQCRAWLSLARGFELWYAGSTASHECFEEAARLLQERCVGAAPELGFAQQMIVGHFIAMGAWNHAVERGRRFSADAAARNDKLYDFVLEIGRVFSALLAGDAALAARELSALLRVAQARREETTFPVRFARAKIASVLGDTETLEEIVAWTREFLSRPEGRMRNLRMMSRLNIGRMLASIARHREGEERARLLQEAEGMLAAALAMGFPHFAATTLIARAGVALAQGHRALALTFLEASIERAPPYADLIVQIARYHHGRLCGGPAGVSERLAAASALRASGVIDIAMTTATLAPWLDSEN